MISAISTVTSLVKERLRGDDLASFVLFENQVLLWGLSFPYSSKSEIDAFCRVWVGRFINVITDINAFWFSANKFVYSLYDGSSLTEILTLGIVLTANILKMHDNFYGTGNSVSQIAIWVLKGADLMRKAINYLDEMT